jgi:hypothetical protein
MINSDLYAMAQIGLELKIVETFKPLPTPEALTSFLKGETDWVSYEPRIVEIVEELNKRMGIAYNYHVAEAAKLLGMEGSGLDTLVYNSQKYRDAEHKIERFKVHLNAIQEEGFCLLTQAQADKLLVDKRLVEIYLTPNQRISARLIKTIANGYCWRMPRYKTRGYAANLETQYVKLPALNQKSSKV